MDDFNPYAALEAEIALGPHSQDESGVWRDGNLLVMSKDAVLPDRCLKCNTPAGGYKLKRNLSWHHPFYFALVVSPLIYLIVALIVRKTAKVLIPVCDHHRRRRTRGIIVACLLTVLGVMTMVSGIASLRGIAQGSGAYVGYFLFGGLGVILGGLIYAIRCEVVALPKRIDTRFVWLKNVDPGFLAALPPWNNAPA